MRGQRHAPADPYPGKDPVPIVQEAGWAPGPVWTGAENLAPTGIRYPDRPSRSQSLYRLPYPAHGPIVRGAEIYVVSSIIHKHINLKFGTERYNAVLAKDFFTKVVKLKVKRCQLFITSSCVRKSKGVHTRQRILNPYPANVENIVSS